MLQTQKCEKPGKNADKIKRNTLFCAGLLIVYPHVQVYQSQIPKYVGLFSSLYEFSLFKSF